VRKIRVDRPADCNFDERRADRVVQFFGDHLTHTKGQWAGRPFELRPWQEQDLREIFGRVNADGSRQIRQVYYEIPKKNGKSEVAAGVALALLLADDEPAAEVYGAAADKDQAGIIYQIAASMVRHSRTLSGVARPIDSTKRIVCQDWESYYRALSADVAGKHGYNTHGVIFDEVHAQRDMDLWSVLTMEAGAARLQPLVYAITTAGVPGESPVAEMLHEEADQILRGVVPCPPDFYPVIYAAPEDAPWDSEDVWRECNPAYGDFLHAAGVRDACERAKRRAAEQNSFRRLRLNQWVQSEFRWIDLAAWDACATPVDVGAMAGLPCYAGLDLSSTTDIAALVLDIPDGNSVHNWLAYFWLPEDALTTGTHREREKYARWAKQGHLTITPGAVIDYSYIRQRIAELSQTLRIREIAYDPWNATETIQMLSDAGYAMVPIRQGFQSLSAPTKELERLVLSRRIRHGGNPVLRWMADCVTTKSDPAGNIRPVKPDRGKSSKRIDGIVAGIMALDRATRHSQAASVYESRGVLVL
jgi:phage terminase large subunit-like protein